MSQIWLKFQNLVTLKLTYKNFALQPPEILKWNGKKNFVQRPEKCPQLASFQRGNDDVVEGNEDCLYINVYRPLKVVKGKLLPVFFWIHGGSFMAGSFDSDINGFDYIVKQVH